MCRQSCFIDTILRQHSRFELIYKNKHYLHAVPILCRNCSIEVVCPPRVAKIWGKVENRHSFLRTSFSSPHHSIFHLCVFLKRARCREISTQFSLGIGFPNFPLLRWMILWEEQRKNKPSGSAIDAMLLDVAQLVCKKSHSPDCITLSAALPPFWLAGHNHLTLPMPM